ncbi:O-glycosyl hydrolase [Sphaerochaeta pleomorpha str. Grapes]|uniref:O-glycosyl hydrolase n=1 Tax=Sphaerochaeta pleomorpha (strain ATCC BAA-1885 / DSM 22778 / Grapes) TaxID=158190 RepID=G8QXC3_SPHPG|nr:glycoside hydrolase family 30 beta sandwich domain-containing protein [Sphaerochaeta pleomorpha]AEV28424.1 O-glycosyl hydrolase [Sphaerochaeta pleomorpha str. Grapes]
MHTNLYVTSRGEGTPLEKMSIIPGIIDDGGIELNIINIYQQVTFQKLQGFGGAITEAVGSVLAALPEEQASTILRSCFSSEGLAYRFVRTSIDSCDFSLSEYCAGKQDESFSLERDEISIIPWIKKAYEIAEEAFAVMLSPWSPPAYMKSNGQRCQGGSLKDEYKTQWAEYICRYIKAYRDQGIRVACLSIQNEPNANQKWESCLYTGAEEKDFLQTYLYPALQKSHLEDIEIFVWDHNKERLFDRAAACIDEKTDPMVAGFAFHWYSGDHFDALRLVKKRYPSKRLLFSEGCIEYSRYDKGNQLYNAQKYGHEIIGNLNAGMDTFIDWNIVLESNGGPNHCNNFCEAPIFVNRETNEIIYNLSYRYIWHFSHFIQPGAVHIASTGFDSTVESVAFRNPEGSYVVVIMNRSQKEQPINLRMAGSLYSFVLAKDSIATAVLSAGDQ